MCNTMTGQISIADYICGRDNVVFKLCSQCVCNNCLYFRSGRCPYDGCYDDHRAEVEPYDKAHPDKPPRDGWSNWDKPGEQAHWCRGGRFYPVHYCPEFVKYDEGKHVVKECLKAIVSVYQDGYMQCSLVDTVGCQRCYEEFLDKEEWV